MRSGSSTTYIDKNYSQNRHANRSYIPEFNRNIQQHSNGNRTQRQYQKTEQRRLKSISPLAIKSINQEIYSIINMDQYSIQSNLRQSTKSIYGLINNELLLNVKQFSNIKLLLYRIILMYIQESSRSYQEQIRNKQKQRQKDKQKQKQKLKQRQKSYSNSHSTTLSNNNNQFNLQQFKEKDISIQQQFFNQQLQNIKQTIPFIPKDNNKSKIIKTSQYQILEEELGSKIQSTKQSLQSILKKIQNYSNYKLNGEDIMRLKKSVMNVSQLKPSYFINVHSTNPSPQLNPTSRNRSQSRQANNSLAKQQKRQRGSMNRNNSRTKTYNASYNNSRFQQVSSNDQGNQLLIEQLEQIIQRKQNRIKQMTKQMSKNLQDHKQLECALQNFEIQVQQFESERKNYQQIIEKLQQQNLNYQLQIKDLKQTIILSRQKQKLKSQQMEGQYYNNLKQFETKQKIFKFQIRNQVEISIQGRFDNRNHVNNLNNVNSSNNFNNNFNSNFNNPNNLSDQKWKQSNSLSGGSGFNDISQITPKRLNKLLPKDIDDEYVLQSNTVTTKKNIGLEPIHTQNTQNDRSFNKFQIIGEKSQKNKIDTSRQDFKELQKQSFQKILFLQALTIQQLIQDL